MKKCFITLSFLFSVCLGYAQPQTGTTEMNKVPHSSLIYELDYSDEIVVSALEEKMKDFGKLPKKSKGFYKYKNVVIPEISSKPLQVYFSVERKSKKDKNKSILSMILANEQDIVFKQDDDADLFQRGKSFLSDFTRNTEVAQHNQEVGDQANELNKAEKKLENLKKEGSDLAKKLKKLQDNISDNEKLIAKQEEQVAAEKKKLADLENKAPNK